MPWFKVDDSFESHPKVKGIPRNKRARAIGLWTLAGSWSARQLTDGFIPNYMLDELACTPADARALVAVDLWTTCDGGFRFKDWHDWQPTRERVEQERAAAKERMRAARERKKAGGSGDVQANTSERSGMFGRSSGEVRSTPRSVTPTRPDPTRPDQEDAAASPSPRKRPATRLPADWAPTEAHKERATDGIDIGREAETFKAHAEANDRRCVNWNAAFTQWLLKARPSSRQQQQTNMQRHIALVQQLGEDQQSLPEIGGQ